jgi:hypothetical protein
MEHRYYSKSLSRNGDEGENNNYRICNAQVASAEGALARARKVAKSIWHVNNDGRWCDHICGLVVRVPG